MKCAGMRCSYGNEWGRAAARGVGAMFPFHPLKKTSSARLLYEDTLRAGPPCAPGRTAAPGTPRSYIAGLYRPNDIGEVSIDLHKAGETTPSPLLLLLVLPMPRPCCLAHAIGATWPTIHALRQSHPAWRSRPGSNRSRRRASAPPQGSAAETCRLFLPTQSRSMCRRQRAQGRHRPAKNALFNLSFSFCLSRAYLGQTIVVNVKMAQNTRAFFRTRATRTHQYGVSNAMRTALCAHSVVVSRGNISAYIQGCCWCVILTTPRMRK
jgi:hypothetical protein